VFDELQDELQEHEDEERERREYLRKNEKRFSEAVAQLIGYIHDDEEEGRLIDQISITPDHLNRDGFVCFALMEDYKAYKYAVYIPDTGDFIMDGF
jgi:hypothetical protein